MDSATKRLSRGGLRFAQDQLHSDLTMAAEDGDADRVAGLMLVHDCRNVLRALDLFAINTDDEISAEHDGLIADVSTLVAATEAGTFGSAATSDLLYEHAVVGIEAHLLGEVGADGVRDDAERGPFDTAVSGEIAQYRFGSVDGDGEANAGALIGAIGGDHGVDADDFAARVEKRATGVAGINGGIGLDGVIDRR